MTQLSPQQQQGINKIKDWFDTGVELGGGVFRLFGPAGTGKTTIAKEVGPALGLRNVMFGTYTGKAAHVLRSKGAAPVSTIHSACYFPTTSEEAKQRLRAAREELFTLELEDGNEDAIITKQAEIQVLEQEAKRIGWEWNPDSEWAHADLIILDEVSMVNAKLAADVEAYGVPVLVLGDPAQLPPVEGGGYYTNHRPDFMLTEIHRQALESPVLELATRIRLSTTGNLDMTPADMSPANLAAALNHDQVICWSNKRRWALIDSMRRKLERQPGVVAPGDRIMCLTNNKDMAVFNGQQFTVLDSTPFPLGPTLRVRTDEGAERTIACYDDGFQGMDMQAQAKNSGAGLQGNRMLATFAQVITCHKAQGSEWGSVYVVNELSGLQWMTSKREGQAAGDAAARQWAYTAVTRASDSVTFTAPVGRR